MHVARYYLQRGANVAALNRAQQAVTDYQGVPAAEEALFIMLKAYEALNMPDMAADTRRILESNFPGSRFLSQGFARERGPWWKLW